MLQPMLTSHIKEKRKQMRRSKGESQWKVVLTNIQTYFSKEDIYTPSKISLTIITVIFFIVFLALVRLSPLFFEIFPDFQNPSSDNLIAMHAGIGTIIFALVIFVAESLRDDEEKDKARVLLKESYLYPLVVVEVLAFFTFIFTRDSAKMGALIIIFLVGLFAIFSISGIISVLLSKYRFAKKRAELFQGRFHTTNNLAFDEIIGNDILFSNLGNKKIKLVSPRFQIRNKSHYHQFVSDKTGIVSDIHLGKLKKAAEIIDKEAATKGFSFSGEEKPDFTVILSDQIQESKIKTYKENNERYLMKEFHSTVDERNCDLVHVDKEILRGSKKLKKIDALIKAAFIIKPEDNFAGEVYQELSDVSDYLLSAIENRRMGKIKELVNLYVQLVDTFLGQIEKDLDGYFAEQARAEIYSPFSRRTPISWFLDNVKNFLERAGESRDQEVIEQIARLLMVTVERAVVKDDYHLFQFLIRHTELLYISALKEEDEDLKEFLVGLPLRLLRRSSRSEIGTELMRKDLSEEKLEKLGLCAVQFLIVFQNLIKMAFDKGDYESFEKFVQESQNFFTHFKPSDRADNVELTRRKLDNQDLRDDKREELEEHLKHQKKLEDIEREIKNRKNQMYFGLAGWILDQAGQRKDDDSIKEFYDFIESLFPSTIENFTEIFLNVNRTDVERFWGWGWWHIKSDEGVHTFDPLEQPRKFYVVRVLSLLASKSDEEIEQIDLPIDTESFSHLLDDLSPLLDDIQGNPDAWKFILKERAIEKIALFKGLLSEAKEKKEKQRREIEKERKISLARVERFKREVITGFRENTNLLSALEYLSAYKDAVKEKLMGEGEWLGINRLDDKAIFFDEWHVHYPRWGEHYGKDFAVGKDKWIFDTLAKNCEEISAGDCKETLRGFEAPSDIVIFTTDADSVSHLSLSGSESFTPGWSQDAELKGKGIERPDVGGFGGWYSFGDALIPVFESPLMEISNQILILDKKKIGKFIQCYPLWESEREECIKDIFYMDIQAFSESEELVKNFLENPPEWFKKIGDETSQRAYLYSRVRIQVLSRLEYQKPADFKGYKITLEED